MKKFYGAIEIGGTKQQLAVVDESGQIVDMLCERIPLPNGAIDILNWIETNFPKLLQKHPVEAIGVGYGGLLETKTGRVLLSCHVPGWENFMLRDWVEEKFHKSCVVVNDTVCGGYAELCLGTGVGYDIFFYTNIGTGIGGGLFIKGKNYDGIGYGGAYFGNTYVSDPTADKPGAVKKLEHLCSGVNIERRLRQPGHIPYDSMLYELCKGNVEKVSCYELKIAADAKDPFALAELDEIGRIYGICLANFITLFAPQRVAIGGGVANLGDVLFEPIRKYAAEYAFDSTRDRYDIVPCKLMDQTVLVGAALYARDGFKTI